MCALGRAETAACQRFTLLAPSGIVSLPGFMKSTATCMVNVGHRVAITRNEFARGELAVEHFEEPGDTGPVRLGPCRHMRYLKFLHRRMRMAEDCCHISEEIHFRPSIPHFNDRGILGSNTEHRRLPVQRLKIAAECKRFGNYSHACD